MALVRICDKCKKPVEGDKFWESSQMYNYNTPKRNPLKINGQVVELKMKIVLACGDPLDICDSCAKKLIQQRASK